MRRRRRGGGRHDGWLAGWLHGFFRLPFFFIPRVNDPPLSPSLSHNGFPISRLECGLNFPWKAVSALLPSHPQHGCKFGLIFGSGGNLLLQSRKLFLLNVEMAWDWDMWSGLIRVATGADFFPFDLDPELALFLPVGALEAFLQRGCSNGGKVNL